MIRIEASKQIHPDKLLFTLEEAEEILSLSRSQLYRLADQGDLATVSIGRSRRISREQLISFVESLEQSPKLRVIR